MAPGHLPGAGGSVYFVGERQKLPRPSPRPSAATDAAFAAYKQNVLSALEDVENAMASLTSARARKAEFAIAYDASNNAAILARSQYQAGLIDFQTLSSSENTLLNARNSLASAQADEALAIAQLYNALGGGWQSMDDRPDEQ